MSVTHNSVDTTPEREARMRELQFLMTRLLYFGDQNASSTLNNKLAVLRLVARFAEERSCSVRDVFTHTELLDTLGACLPDQAVSIWMTWLVFLSQLDYEVLGFNLKTPKRWKDLERRARQYRANSRQHAPLPTRIYSKFINNLNDELDFTQRYKPQLLALLKEAIIVHRSAKATETADGIHIGPSLIKNYNLAPYLERCGYSSDKHILRSLSGVISDIFRVCKLQIHLFSGMRSSEARHLPYHCMVTERGFNGRKHSLIEGITTKLNKGQRLRTKWVTTEQEGFRAILLAQEFAAVIYEAHCKKPSELDDQKDKYPLFPSGDYLPWMQCRFDLNGRMAAAKLDISRADDSLMLRLCPQIEEEDILELEQIDPFRAWREEPEFEIGKRWPLCTHQLRRSLAIYANVSGFVRLSSLRRQLQHLSREMTLYYQRGSTFCKNFTAENLSGFKKHVAVEWQNGAEEAEMLAFVRDVLNCSEPMFGGAGVFYERQRERGEVMSRDEITKQMKAGLLSYREGPLGGCTRPGVCETQKGLNLINTICATQGCKHLIGKHSKVVQTIRLKRAAMIHITPGSITEAMEREELAALERIEREWRPEEESGESKDKDA